MSSGPTAFGSDATSGHDRVFPDEAANAQAPVFNAIPQAEVRDRLILRPAKPGRAPADTRVYRLDIVLQGEGETPFFVD